MDYLDEFQIDKGAYCLYCTSTHTHSIINTSISFESGIFPVAMRLAESIPLFELLQNCLTNDLILS